jgi:transposase
MDILHTRCAGIDVHKKNVKVCLSITDEHGKRKKEIRTYLTMTHQFLELRDWLKEQGCSHIAFEATGVYWKPVFNEARKEILRSWSSMRTI